MKRRVYTFEQHLKEKLQDPKFRKAWEESEVDFALAQQVIKARLKKKLSQINYSRPKGRGILILASRNYQLHPRLESRGSRLLGIELAKRVGTSQAAISRIEGMDGNPSLSFLKRLSAALGVKLSILLS